MTPGTGIFMDRDGLINVPPPPEDRYVLDPDGFLLMPGVSAAIRMLNARKIPVGVVTNQKGVAIGKVPLETLKQIHQRMHELLAAEKAEVQDVQFCPHQESDACSCRKPLPGMIFQAARALNIDPAGSWMMGDQPRDLEAGRAAGCRTLIVGREPTRPGLADVRLTHTGLLPDWIAENFPFQMER